MEVETNAYWRYQTLLGLIEEHPGSFTPTEMKENNACVNILRMLANMNSDPSKHSIAAGIQARTLWHSLYNQQARSAEFSFYLGEETLPDGTRRERRSEYIKFELIGNSN